jgi:hypothetical protein
MFQYKTPNPRCQFSCKPPLPQNPNPPFGILCNLFFFTFWKPINMALIFLGALTMWGFYFILFFDLNSRAFQLEIKWCDPFENQRGQAMLTIGISKKTFASYSHGNKVHIQMFAHSIQIICKNNLATQFKHENPPLPHIHPWSDEGNYLHTWATYEDLQCCGYMPYDNEPLL